jgi:MFS family permease
MNDTRSAALAPFASPAFRFLFAGRLATTLANAVAPIALVFAVLDLGGSPTQVGLVLASRTVPLIVLVLFGGVIADRLPRHLVVVVANVTSMVTQGAVATLLLTGAAEIWHLAVIEAINGASSAFLFPAASGLTPQTVPPAQIQSANVLLRLATSFSQITGSAAGGLLVAVSGSGYAFAGDAILYAVGALLLHRIRLPAGDRVASSRIFDDLREGWSEFRGRSWLWIIVVQFAFVNAAVSGGFSTLGPVVADGTIGRAAWGGVLAAQTVGMLAGGLIALRSTSSRPLLVGTVAVLLQVPVLLVLGLEPRLMPLLVVAFLGGIGMEIFGVAWDVSMQSHVPPEKLSRVYAYDWFGSLAFIPIGQAAAGPLASWVGTPATIVGAALVVLLATLAALAAPSVRDLRRVEAREDVPGLQPG